MEWKGHLKSDFDSSKWNGRGIWNGRGSIVNNSKSISLEAYQIKS